MNRLFVVTLRGTHVFHECSLQFAVSNTGDETLNKIKDIIAKQCNLEVYDFTRQYGVLVAWTNDTNVKVFIEEIELIPSTICVNAED